MHSYQQKKFHYNLALLFCEVKLAIKAISLWEYKQRVDWLLNTVLNLCLLQKSRVIIICQLVICKKTHARVHQKCIFARWKIKCGTQNNGRVFLCTIMWFKAMIPSLQLLWSHAFQLTPSFLLQFLSTIVLSMRILCRNCKA